MSTLDEMTESELKMSLNFIDTDEDEPGEREKTIQELDYVLKAAVFLEDILIRTDSLNEVYRDIKEAHPSNKRRYYTMNMILKTIDHGAPFQHDLNSECVAQTRPANYKDSRAYFIKHLHRSQVCNRLTDFKKATEDLLTLNRTYQNVNEKLSRDRTHIVKSMEKRWSKMITTDDIALWISQADMQVVVLCMVENMLLGHMFNPDTWYNL